MSVTTASLFLTIAGLFGVIYGLSFHFDYTRRPIVFTTIYSSGVYVGVPGGICFILLALTLLLPTLELRRSFAILPGIFGIIGAVFGLTTPKFVSPWWFRYLRERYRWRFIMDTLMPEAAKDYEGWMERTKTLKGLKSWADEIAHGHGANTYKLK